MKIPSFARTFSLAKTILAIDWDARHLRVLQCRLGHDRLGVSRALTVQIPQDLELDSPEALGKFIAKVLSSEAIHTKAAVMSVPRQHAVLHALEAYVGVRWFIIVPLGEVVPDVNTVSLTVYVPFNSLQSVPSPQSLAAIPAISTVQLTGNPTVQTSQSTSCGQQHGYPEVMLDTPLGSCPNRYSLRSMRCMFWRYHPPPSQADYSP